MKIAERLLEARTKIGASKAEISRRVGVFPKDYANWENGVNVPTAQYLIKLSKAFGVTIDWILGEKDTETIEEVDTMGEDQRDTTSHLHKTIDGRLLCDVEHCAWRKEGVCPGAGCMRERERNY